MTSKLKFNLKTAVGGLMTRVEEISKDIECIEFHPTGALEPAIAAVGYNPDRETDIKWLVNLQCNNKGGKTALGAEILKNIMWDCDPMFFDFEYYREWPFRDKDGSIIKRIRIVGTPKNVADNGPIQKEIKKWWPKGRYTMAKASQKYFSSIKTDTGWEIDIMTFKQEPSEFEGDLISFHWIDEPARAQLIGSFTSRMSKGGVLLFTQTPLGAAPMLDVFEDLQRVKDGKPGTNIITISSTMEDNSIETGKLNSKGTMRGLMTNAEIDAYERDTPIQERDARIRGLCLQKEGKIYRIFNEEIHCRDIPWTDTRWREANCYCVIDPCDKYYPYISWWAVFPPNLQGVSYKICYNEWPTFGTFNEYYDEVRHNPKIQFKMTYEKLSQIIKLFDNTQYGFHIVKRGIDPRYSQKTNIQEEFLNYGLDFIAPPAQRIEVQRNTILTLLDYDTQMPINQYNEPSMYVMRHCINMKRCLGRHYWEESEKWRPEKGRVLEVEAEKYKDPCDTVRYFLALEADTGYRPISADKRKTASNKKNTNKQTSKYIKMLRNISM